MMQAGRADTADVHARPFPDRLETFEDGYIFRCVTGCHSERASSGVQGYRFSV
jgi:hypothetical protein